MIKRLLGYLAANTFMAAMLFFGFALNEQGAINVAVFLAWTLTVIMVLTSHKDEVIEAGAKKGKHPVPAWFDAAFDTSVVAVFIWNGYWWTGAAYAIHALLCAAYRSNVDKKISEELPN